MSNMPETTSPALVGELLGSTLVGLALGLRLEVTGACGSEPHPAASRGPATKTHSSRRTTPPFLEAWTPSTPIPWWQQAPGLFQQIG